MKVLLSSFGTRGDVQPYLALAVGLQAAGHHVTLATSYNYTEWIRAYGVHVRPTRFNSQEFLQRPEAQAVLKGGNVLKQIWLMREWMRQNAEAQGDVWTAIQDADYFIQSPTSSGALEAAHILGMPVAFASPIPFVSTRAYPSFFLGSLRYSLGAGYNTLTHRLMHQVLWNMMGAPITNKLRNNLGLRPWRSYSELLAHSSSLGVPWLYGISRHVLPRPADWDEQQHVTGYWFLDAEPGWKPSPELVRFIESGSPPVYCGFGSINLGDGDAKTELILRALEMTSQRGIVLTGWGGLSRKAAPSHVLFVDNVPHDWLFPRMAAVLHHGGAGSTGAGLRAGVPNIVTPLGGDQYAWAERVVQLGVGPKALDVKRLNVENLANAIHTAVNDLSIRGRAKALGEKIRAENGIAQAVEIIERNAARLGRQSTA